MRWILVGVAVIGLWVGTASAKKGWKRLVGKPCPSLNVEWWLNTGRVDPTPKDLVGSVWMLEFLSVG